MEAIQNRQKFINNIIENINELDGAFTSSLVSIYIFIK
jgi:hypothetical protein